jgi:hypothetical protein
LRSIFLICVLCFILGSSCRDQTQETSISSTDSVTVLSADTIPEIRKQIIKDPIASFEEKLDTLNNWKFAVSIYETSNTFKYRIHLEAKEVRVSDSLIIPNFGRQPKVVIQKGKEPHTCIIGFLDKKDEFKEYRKVSFQDDRLRIKTIQSYYVGHYQNKS